MQCQCSSYVPTDRVYLTSRPPYWCTKQRKRRPCWCTEKNPVGIEDISTMKNCICSNKFVKLLTMWVKTISTNHWVLSCYRWVTTSAFCSPWRILLTTKDSKTKRPFGRLAWLTWTSTFTTWTRSRGSGCIWSPSLAEELYLESRDGLREWMMISGLLYSKNPQVRTYIFWS